MYTSPVLDPLYKAQSETESDRSGQKVKYYRPNTPVSVLACTDQFQFCNVRTNICTPLTDESAAQEEAKKLDLNSVQNATFWYFNSSSWLTLQTVHYSTHSLGAGALHASDSLQAQSLLHPGLPPDQWQIDVSGWFATGLARLQQKVVNYALGPVEADEHMINYSGNSDLCSRQKIRTPFGYTNFSTLGVAIILALGSIIVLNGMFIDKIVGLYMRKANWKDFKRRLWAHDESLQLMRVAYEGVGQGVWTGESASVPVTRKGDMLTKLLSETHVANVKEVDGKVIPPYNKYDL